MSVYLYTHPGMACLVFLLCVPGGGLGPACQQQTLPSAVSCTGSNVSRHM